MANANKPKPVNSSEYWMADRLLAAFPWLGTDDDAGSGADVIERLQALYDGLADPLTRRSK